MSKKKNTLQDLDEFLKQQAATLVPPEKLSEKVDEPKTLQQQAPSIVKTETETTTEISQEKILRDLKMFSEQEGVFFRKKFYEMIIKSLEAQNLHLPEDKMLINTALYLQAGSEWKEVIREYWRKKS